MVTCRARVLHKGGQAGKEKLAFVWRSVAPPEKVRKTKAVHSKGDSIPHSPAAIAISVSGVMQQLM